MNNKSVYYPFIDTAKGFGVFCVLITHMSWVVGYNSALLTKIVSTFFLGLLFIASGFVSGKIWSGDVKFRNLLSGKYYKVLIPFFVVGLTFILLQDLNQNGVISKNPFQRLLCELFNGGYWYLLSLFVFRIITVCSQLISQCIFKHIKDKSIVRFGLGNALIMCVLCYAVYVIASIVGISLIVNYFSYYLIGILIYHNSLHGSILRNEIFVGLAIILSFLLFVFNFYYTSSYLGKSVIIGILTSVTTFVVIVNSSSNRIVDFFKRIGGYSLDVYVLHYFFLIGSFNLIDRDWFVAIPWLIQSMVLIAGALILLYCSCILSKFIRRNPMLTKCILGS